MQSRLIELGFLDYGADGDFGPRSEEAVKAAQRAFGMEDNGIADNAFLNRLFSDAPVPSEPEEPIPEDAAAQDIVVE